MPLDLSALPAAPETRPTLAEAIAAALAEAITRGEMPPGTTLEEERLALAHGASRTPVREALRLLVATGLVEQRPRRGAVVALGDSAEEAVVNNRLRGALDSALAGMDLLQGDAAQYRPVAAGAPFALLQRLQTPARLDKIARQQGRTDLDGIWMRAASVDFSQGQTERAIEAYDRMGHIAWEPDRKTAVENAVSAYMKHRIEHPNETRAMTIQWKGVKRALSMISCTSTFRMARLSIVFVSRGRPQR